MDDTVTPTQHSLLQRRSRWKSDANVSWLIRTVASSSGQKSRIKMWLEFNAQESKRRQGKNCSESHPLFRLVWEHILAETRKWGSLFSHKAFLGSTKFLSHRHDIYGKVFVVTRKVQLLPSRQTQFLWGRRSLCSTCTRWFISDLLLCVVTSVILIQFLLREMALSLSEP